MDAFRYGDLTRVDAAAGQLFDYFLRRHERLELVISGFEPLRGRKETQPDLRRPLVFKNALFVKPGDDRRRAGAWVDCDGLLRGFVLVRSIDLAPQPHRAADHSDED